MNYRVWLVIVQLLAACGSDDGEAPKSYAGEPDAAHGCVDISGTWLIRAHCGAALVGMSVGITQSGCSFTTSGSFPGFSGTLDADGKFDLSGTANGMNVTCQGTATAQQITQSCTGNCNVTLGR